MVLLTGTQINIQTLEVMFLHRFEKWRHLLQCLKRSVYKRVTLFVYKFMEFYQTISDSPADLPLILLFIGTIIFVIWSDYEHNKKHK